VNEAGGPISTASSEPVDATPSNQLNRLHFALELKLTAVSAVSRMSIREQLQEKYFPPRKAAIFGLPL
jgi:hypothetical protein